MRCPKRLHGPSPSRARTRWSFWGRVSTQDLLVCAESACSGASLDTNVVDESIPEVLVQGALAFASTRADGRKPASGPAPAERGTAHLLCRQDGPSYHTAWTWMDNHDQSRRNGGQTLWGETPPSPYTRPACPMTRGCVCQPVWRVEPVSCDARGPPPHVAGTGSPPTLDRRSRSARHSTRKPMAEGQLSPEVYSLYDGGRSVMLRFDGEDFTAWVFGTARDP